MRAFNLRWVLIAAALAAIFLSAILFAHRPTEDRATSASSGSASPATASSDPVDPERTAIPPLAQAGPGITASDYMNGPMVEESRSQSRELEIERSSQESSTADVVPADTAAAPIRANMRRSEVAAECWDLRGSAPRDYVVTLDRELRTSGEASALVSSRRATSGYVTMFQTSSAAPVKGRRVEFSADVRTRGAKGSANLLLRAEDAYGNTVAFDNMATSYEAARRPDKLVNRGVMGDSEWSTQHVVVDIPPEAAVITYGMSLFGEGKAWIDNARLEVVTDEMQTTAIDVRQSPTPPNGIPVNPAALSRSPRNLEFDLTAMADAPACD